MTHYILISSNDGTEQVMAYEASEMAQIYTRDENLRLESGLAIFRGGAIHVDMQAAARAEVVFLRGDRLPNEKKRVG
jgi:hypothetical protein